METKVKRREWVKSAAIVFLSVLLVLTFFSNTIMNRSLPEVAAQYVESGSINARIRGSGTVAANEVYEVSLSQTRKVQSVLVKVGQEVLAGDPLLRLESMESEELKAAQKTLDQMELSYQMALVELSNSDSQENRQIQKLREDYEEALTTLRLYSNKDPEQISLLQKEAEQELSALQQKQRELQNALTELTSNRAYAEAKANVTLYEGEYETALAAFDKARAEIDQNNTIIAEIDRKESLLPNADDYYDKHDLFLATVSKSLGADKELCAVNIQYYMNVLQQTGQFYTQTEAEELQNAYNAIVPIMELQKSLLSTVEVDQLSRNLHAAESSMNTAQSALNQAKSTVAAYQAEEDQIQNYITDYNNYITQQQSLVENYSKAAGAADALKAAEEALEDAVFESQLGSSQNLQLQADREEIEAQKKLIEELSKEADGKEIAANVSGVISAIHVSAGSTAAAEQPVVEITVADRGYTISVPVTTEQARQVRVGDTAQITNYYWGDITATLENIANDPQSMGKQKLLIFRISGEGVEAGTNLTLSIGQRSANYDCLVPNSAIRSDANGSFVLVVTAKSSPLGNRYVANRVEVQVLASDDTMSAVTGLANGDFVITTSTKPLEAGDMVRLPDNG